MPTPAVLAGRSAYPTTWSPVPWLNAVCGCDAQHARHTAARLRQRVGRMDDRKGLTARQPARSRAQRAPVQQDRAAAGSEVAKKPNNSHHCLRRRHPRAARHGWEHRQPTEDAAADNRPTTAKQLKAARSLPVRRQPTATVPREPLASKLEDSGLAFSSILMAPPVPGTTRSSIYWVYYIQIHSVQYEF